LIKLFDVYLHSGNVAKAAESLERLVDIDAYDYRNQERLELLRGRVDEAYLKRVGSRLAKSGTETAAHTTHPTPGQSVAPPPPLSEEGRNKQALEDLIVQTEIFLQYSLQSKALERLQRIAAMFPGEEEHSARLANLYQLANCGHRGGQAESGACACGGCRAGCCCSGRRACAHAHYGEDRRLLGDTLRDLSKISEINRRLMTGVSASPRRCCCRSMIF